MYATATKFNLPDLREECVNFLKSNLSAAIAGDILISADKWNDGELKESISDFVVTHRLEIVSSEEWEQVMLKRSDLASEVLKKTLILLLKTKLKLMINNLEILT